MNINKYFSKFKELVKNIFGGISMVIFFILIIGAFVWVFGGGIYHSFSKHYSDDGYESIFNPILDVYRSIEFFWHDDYSDVNWDKRLVADIKTIRVIINDAVDNKSDFHEIQKQIEPLGSEIQNYPKVQLEKLKLTLRMILKFSLSIFSDILETGNRISDNNKIKFEYSDKSLKLKSDLEQSIYKEELINVDNFYLRLFDILNKAFQEASNIDRNGDKLKSIVNKYENIKSNNEHIVKYVFQNLFDEKFE